MNRDFDRVIAADERTRTGLFDATAQRMGTTARNVEKDFWVCWTLDALFNGRPEVGPRLLFKGGTSLSKGFGLIDRFSEDIDVTVFRDDIGAPATVGELAAMSGKKRRSRLEEIKTACQAYVTGPLREQLSAVLSERLLELGVDSGSARIEIDETDSDRQSLRLWYPAATPRSGYVEGSDYVQAFVKIEAGAKSALDPHVAKSIQPYVQEDLPDLDLTVPAVTIVSPERTFWDKVVILHGLRSWFDRRGELRGGGERVSRHYYDVHRLLSAPEGRTAMLDRSLGADCVDHARLFFHRPDFGLDDAVLGRFALSPCGEMVDALRRDYDAMTSMIFGAAPGFATVMASIENLEAALNEATEGLRP